MTPRGDPKMTKYRPMRPMLGRPLSPREHATLMWLCGGLTNKEIATLMDITDSSVKSMTKQVFAKLGVTTRTAATVRAIREGWFKP
jgi:DNA-binding NarL/FixJ family response regulator